MISQEAVDAIEANTSKWQRLQDLGVDITFPPCVVACEDALKVGHTSLPTSLPTSHRSSGTVCGTARNSLEQVCSVLQR